MILTQRVMRILCRLQGYHRDSGLVDVQKDPMGERHPILLAIILRSQDKSPVGSLSTRGVEEGHG